MTISIITSTYNSATTLKDTIESVLSQTWTDIDYIIVDGGSTDETLQIIKQNESRFHGKMRWVSEPDEGIYDAMNKGIAMACGDVIGILNSDDVLFDNRVIERVAKAFENPETDCVFGDLLYVSRTDLNKIVRIWKGSPYEKGCFSKGWHPAHPTFYVRKEHFGRLGGYDTSLDISADFEFMLRYLEVHQLRSAYLPYFMVKMRTGGVSNGSVKGILTGNQNIVKAFRKHGIPVSRFYMPIRITRKACDVIVSKIKLLRQKN